MASCDRHNSIDCDKYGWETPPYSPFKPMAYELPLLGIKGIWEDGWIDPPPSNANTLLQADYEFGRPPFGFLDQSRLGPGSSLGPVPQTVKEQYLYNALYSAALNHENQVAMLYNEMLVESNLLNRLDTELLRRRLLLDEGQVNFLDIADMANLVAESARRFAHHKARYDELMKSWDAEQEALQAMAMDPDAHLPEVNQERMHEPFGLATAGRPPGFLDGLDINLMSPDSLRQSALLAQTRTLAETGFRAPTGPPPPSVRAPSAGITGHGNNPGPSNSGTRPSGPGTSKLRATAAPFQFGTGTAKSYLRNTVGGFHGNDAPGPSTIRTPSVDLGYGANPRAADVRDEDIGAPGPSIRTPSVDLGSGAKPLAADDRDDAGSPGPAGAPSFVPGLAPGLAPGDVSGPPTFAPGQTPGILTGPIFGPLPGPVSDLLSGPYSGPSAPIFGPSTPTPPPRNPTPSTDDNFNPLDDWTQFIDNFPGNDGPRNRWGPGPRIPNRPRDHDDSTGFLRPPPRGPRNRRGNLGRNHRNERPVRTRNRSDSV